MSLLEFSHQDKSREMSLCFSCLYFLYVFFFFCCFHIIFNAYQFFFLLFIDFAFMHVSYFFL